MRTVVSKKQAQKEARRLRKKFPNKTVNTVRVGRSTWGNRFSPKGKRDKFDYRTGSGNWKKGSRFRKKKIWHANR